MSYVRYVVDGSNPPVTAGSAPGGQSDFAKATDVSFGSQVQADANQALNAGNRTGDNGRAIAARLAAEERALVNRLNNQ